MVGLSGWPDKQETFRRCAKYQALEKQPVRLDFELPDHPCVTVGRPPTRECCPSMTGAEKDTGERNQSAHLDYVPRTAIMQMPSADADG